MLRKFPFEREECERRVAKNYMAKCLVPRTITRKCDLFIQDIIIISLKYFAMRIVVLNWDDTEAYDVNTTTDGSFHSFSLSLTLERACMRVWVFKCVSLFSALFCVVFVLLHLVLEYKSRDTFSLLLSFTLQKFTCFDVVAIRDTKDKVLRGRWGREG